MKRGLPWALGLVLCVLVAGVAYVIYRNAVPYQEVIDHGPSPRPWPTLTWPPSSFCSSADSRSSTPMAWKYCRPWSPTAKPC